MDQKSIDALARLVAAGETRRGLLGAAAAALPAALLGLRPARGAAGCKKVGHKCDNKTERCCKGARCKDGTCRCKGSREECGGLCVRLNSDEANCGACDNACANSETCCDGSCVDLDTDADNCGSCGRACVEGQECTVGVCRYPAGSCLAGFAACESVGWIACGGISGLCQCYRSTEGEIICGGHARPDFTCGECATSADCTSYGANAFCIASGTHWCGCGTSAQNFCGLPCDE